MAAYSITGDISIYLTIQGGTGYSPVMNAITTMQFSSVASLQNASQTCLQAFSVQHINNYDVPTTGANLTIGAVDTLSTVVLNTSSGYLSGGESGNTTGMEIDEASLGIDLTSATNVNFARQGTALRQTRANASVFEYKGAIGGPNEIVVRARGNITLTPSNRTLTATCDTTPTNIDDCVVFITGFSNSRASLLGYGDLSGIAWLSGTNTINFERGGNRDSTIYYYTVVEFTGSNWTVHHGHSGDVVADTGNVTLTNAQKGTGTTSNVASWGKAFIYGQFKADDSVSNANCADLYPVYTPNTTSTVQWIFDAAHVGNDNQHLIYAIENSDPNFSVARYNTGAITFPSGNITQTISAVTDLTQALVLCTAEENTASTVFLRGYRNAGFTSTTQVYAWCHRANGVGQVEFQVIDFYGMDCGGVPPNSISGSTDLAFSDNTTATAKAIAISVTNLSIFSSSTLFGNNFIPITKQSLTLTDNNATIVSGVNTTLDPLSLVSYNPSVVVDNNISVSANVDALTLTEYNVTLLAPTIFTATVDALTLTSYNTSSDWPVPATVTSITLTEYNPTIVFDTKITTTRPNFNYTNYFQSIEIGFETQVACGTEALTLTKYNTTVDAPVSVRCTFDSLSLQERFPTLTHPGYVDDNATDSDRKMEEWYYAQWEALRLAIHKYYGIDDNNSN